MKRKYSTNGKFLILFLVLMQISACSVHKNMMEKKQKAFSVLGLGDSITEGGPDFFSYLFPLDSILKQNGYQAHFIGPRFSVLQGDTLHHAGFSGKTAEFLAKSVDSIYAAFPADIVLLHSGHNHFQEEAPIGGIIQAQQKIIEVIKSKNPKVVLLVAGVITSGKLPKYAYIPELDLSIKKMVDAMQDASIIFVDQQQQWDWNRHTIQDKVHPNQTGARVIASNWYDAMIKVLNKQQ
jgi:acetyl esterase